MLNQGIRTNEVNLVRWVADPAASDADIVEAMRLPPGLSIEALLLDELAAIDSYHQAWTENSDLDTRELFLRNSACKRALYLSAPIFLPDNIPVDTFVPTGVNSRVHVYPATEVFDTIRLEAISSYVVGDQRFRYALSIQYALDEVGLGWQVIRPVVIVDPRILAAAQRAGAAGTARLQRVWDAVARIVLLGSHDYVHATVLNWFPPLRNLAPEYAAIMSERVHPPEVDEWHAGSQDALPDGLMPTRPTPGIATLELYSLMVHAQVIGRLTEEDTGIGAAARATVNELTDALAALLADDLVGDEARRRDVADYVTMLAGWFLVSAYPLGSDGLAELFAMMPAGSRERARERLTDVHGGMFDFVRFVAFDKFPWRGRLVGLHDVAAEYEVALRWPTLREHLQYLLLPRRAGHAAAPAWLEVLCAPLADAQRAHLLAALAALRVLDDKSEWERRLRALDEDGSLDVLRSISRPDSAADGQSGEVPAPIRYARSILAGFVRVASAVGAEPAALPV